MEQISPFYRSTAPVFLDLPRGWYMHRHFLLVDMFEMNDILKSSDI